MDDREFNFSDFTRIRVGEAFEVEIVRADTYSIHVSADDFSHIRVEKDGETLRVGRRGVDWMAPFHGQPRARITLPELKELSLNGASHGRIEGIQSPDFSVKLLGASHLEMRSVTARNANIEVVGASNLTGDIKTENKIGIKVAGASKIELTGNSTDAEIDASGASQLRLADFTLNNADLKVNGASGADIKVNGKLDIDLSGASRIKYTGNPTLGKVKVAGASSLDKK